MKRKEGGRKVTLTIVTHKTEASSHATLIQVVVYFLSGQSSPSKQIPLNARATDKPTPKKWGARSEVMVTRG